MTLSPAFLDEIRSRTLLSALIGRTVKLTRAGREWKACCPFHDEKSPSFTVNDDKAFYHCFGCSAHGDAIRFLTETRGLPFIDAVKELADAAGMEMPAADPRGAERAERASGLHDVMAAAQVWFAGQLNGIDGGEARAYLTKRDIDAPAIETFGLGFAPDSRSKLKAALSRFGDDMLVEAGLLILVDDKEPYDRFRGRLIIPIRDPRGRVIAFGGRILGAGEPKYLNSPDTPLFDKGRTLYNLDRAAGPARKADRLIVVEGYMDVIALAQAGIDEVVAPLGTALTEAQLERLWRLTDVPLLCFDGDGAGQKAAMRAALRALPMLAPAKSLDFVTLPRGQDPDDIIRRSGIAAMLGFLERPETMVSKVFHNQIDLTSIETPEQRAGLRTRLDDLARLIGNRLVSSEYADAFRNLFFKYFGFKRGAARNVGQKSKFSAEDVVGVRAAMSGARINGRDGTDNTIIRAILFGLSRYSDVLIAEREAIQFLSIENSHLASWRDILVRTTYDHAELSEDLIETILAASDVSPIEKRDIRRDLAFSFFRRGQDRAKRDLKEVIEICVAERETRSALAVAEARFRASLEAEADEEASDWEEHLALKLRVHELDEARKEWATLLNEAA